MIALILGGSPAVWSDLAAAEALLGDRQRLVVAANLAGIKHDGRLDGWATLHPDLLAGWAARRAGNRDFRAFLAAPNRDIPLADVVEERWPGSSGLYAVQVALFEMGATGAILCGVPMDSDAGHFCNPGRWADVGDYRQAFCAALPVIGARVRSMGGWTADLFGCPTEQWIAALHAAKPLGSTSPQHGTRTDMHRVKNNSKIEQRFKHIDPEGEMAVAVLQPGESGVYDINPAQAAFQGDDLEIKPTTAEPTAAKVDAKTPPTGA